MERFIVQPSAIKTYLLWCQSSSDYQLLEFPFFQVQKQLVLKITCKNTKPFKIEFDEQHSRGQPLSSPQIDKFIPLNSDK